MGKVLRHGKRLDAAPEPPEFSGSKLSQSKVFLFGSNQKKENPMVTFASANEALCIVETEIEICILVLDQEKILGALDAQSEIEKAA